MIDYVKLRIGNVACINTILAGNVIDFKSRYSENTGEYTPYPKEATYKVWELEMFNESLLEIRGSIHKYWNNGTNETDFNYYQLFRAIVMFCNDFNINPLYVSIHNLEYGVNVRPAIDASEILSNVICYHNRESDKKIREGMYFIEFAMTEYYFKLYDKGEQARANWNLKDAGNILRVEVKAVKSRGFADAGVKCLIDLLNPKSLQVLGRKTLKKFENVVYDDPTINPDLLKPTTRKVYEKYRNPREWVKNVEGIKSSTLLAQENQFRAIVAQHGTLQLWATIYAQIADKWQELLQDADLHKNEVEHFIQHCKNCGISYLSYTVEPLKPTERKCVSCGRDITGQRSNSRYCSAKVVGEKNAHQCRNKNSNPRNNYKRQLEKICDRGNFLFDITPYLRKVG